MHTSRISKSRLLTLLAFGVSLALTALASAGQTTGDAAKASPAQEKAQPGSSQLPVATMSAAPYA